MEERDDRYLRESYNQARPHSGERAPDFESMMERAQDASRARRHAGRRVWLAAAAVLLAVSVAVFSLMSADTELPEASPQAQSVEAVTDDEDRLAAPSVVDDERWEELVELADELWEEEYPTDFLLVSLENDELWE